MAPTLSGRSGGKLEGGLEFVLRISGVFERRRGRAASSRRRCAARSRKRHERHWSQLQQMSPLVLGLMRRHAAAVLLLVILTPALAASEERPPTPSRAQPRLPGAIVCLVPRPPICHKPCVTWARGQPDFQFSYDACGAKCRAELPCSQ